jgi:hypothetical protein
MDPRWIWVCVHFFLGCLGEGWSLEGEVWGSFPGVGPGGYLDTSEGNWNSWSHNAMRLHGQPMLEPWKGSGAA